MIERGTRICVTGGAGFIGSWMSKRLLKLGCEITIVDDLSRGAINNISPREWQEIEFVRLDIAEPGAVSSLTELFRKRRFCLILHYAAVNGTMHFYDSPVRTACVNSLGTLNLLYAIVESKIANTTKLVFASTSEVYGEPSIVPTPESAEVRVRPDQIRDSYSAAKVMSEVYIKSFAKETGLEYMILRIFNVYGPGMVDSKYGQVVPELIRRSVEDGGPLVLVGDGKQTRSFCYISDHIDMTLSALRCDDLWGGCVNIGNDLEISIVDLARTIRRLLDLPESIKLSEDRPGDIRRRCPDISKLRQCVGPISFTSLKSGLEEVIATYK